MITHFYEKNNYFSILTERLLNIIVFLKLNVSHERGSISLKFRYLNSHQNNSITSSNRFLRRIKKLEKTL